VDGHDAFPASASERDLTTDDAHLVVPSQRRATDLGTRVMPPVRPSPTDARSPEGAADVAARTADVASEDAWPIAEWRDEPSPETGSEGFGVAQHHESEVRDGSEPDASPAVAAEAHSAAPERPVRGPSRSRPFRRRRVWPVVAVGAVLVGVLVATLGSGPGQRPVGSPVASPAVRLAGALASIDELRQRAAEAARGEAPMALAAEDLLTWAATAVHAAPHPVQPLVVVGNDNELVSDATRVYGLGLAYLVSGNEQFATAAAATIKSWVETVHWADDTCTDSGGCHTTLSISRAAPGFVFGASLIADSPAWTADQASAFRSWLRSVILPAASERPNNWGDAGTFMRVAVSDYLGDEAAFGAAIDKWRSSMDLIESTGRIPEESRRGTAGISYTQEALQYKLAVAQIAERRGIDLWDVVGAKGGSLKVALDRLAYFSEHPDEWPDAANAEVPAPGPAWELAYAHWRDPAWVPLVTAVRPYGDRGHSAIRWTTFTNGVPVDPITATGSPSASPSAEPSAIESSEPSASASPGSPAPPPLTAIRARLVASAAMGDVAVKVSWVAPASADRVRLEWSTGGSWHGLVATDQARGSIIDARPPGTVAYRGRPTRDGVAGAWLELPDVTTGRIDARSTTLALDGSWSMAGSAGYSFGTALSTDQVGATATWKGTARDLLIIGPVGPTRGEIEVIVDGKLKHRISLRASSYVARQVLEALHWATSGAHTVVIRAAGAAGRTAAIDELVRLDSGPLSSPASTP
jgi:hypothetical protein